MNQAYIRKYSDLNERARQLAILLKERQIELATKKTQERDDERKNNSKEKSSESNS